MKDLDPTVLIAVFQEMLGPFFWIGLGAAALVLVLFLWLLLRERGLRAARLAWSELVGLVGGGVAILVMQAVTHSGFADIGGPIDWVLIALIWLAGAVLATLAAYVGLGLIGFPARHARATRSGAGAPATRQRPA
jgi:hypothetical protein